MNAQKPPGKGKAIRSKEARKAGVSQEKYESIKRDQARRDLYKNYKLEQQKPTTQPKPKPSPELKSKPQAKSTPVRTLTRTTTKVAGPMPKSKPVPVKTITRTTKKVVGAMPKNK
jgi:hypothetical protein